MTWRKETPEEYQKLIDFQLELVENIKKEIRTIKDKRKKQFKVEALRKEQKTLAEMEYFQSSHHMSSIKTYDPDNDKKEDEERVESSPKFDMRKYKEECLKRRNLA